ncbi:MAG: serine O-acetyltransferase [Synergistaceae bacterium]|jgi:serine O-acetyltransferase|nr:serine O-acetyltransferase [Synergistaceae bacterium]
MRHAENTHEEAKGKNRTYPDIEKILDSFITPSNGRERNIPLPATDMPSSPELARMMEMIRAVVFPGFFGTGGIDEQSMRHHMASGLDDIFRILAEQIRLGMCFIGRDQALSCKECEDDALELAGAFMGRLPDVRNLLDSDVLAAFEGDPAAKSKAETIFCYPSIHIMTNHRVAHELYKLEVPVIPRIISEMGHSRTGIDINPGASIGEEFFIDHGTGVVIGETAVIGSRCRLYQGVTLGALSFPKDALGNPIKGLPRHPVLEDNVVVYAGATILGRVTIGAGSMIGGNVWITGDVPKGSKVVQQRSTSPAKTDRMQG